MKPLLLISRHAPWSGLSARETLDIALAGGAFDLPVSLLWQGEGVYQLLAGQQPARLEQKNLQSQLSGLPLFGVNNLYVCGRSLEERGMDAGQLALEASVLDAPAIRELLAGHAQVLVF